MQLDILEISDDILEKIEAKHAVRMKEVEEACFSD